MKNVLDLIKNQIEDIKSDLLTAGNNERDELVGLLSEHARALDALEKFERIPQRIEALKILEKDYFERAASAETGQCIYSEIRRDVFAKREELEKLLKE